MKDIYSKTGASTCKLTHLRTGSLQNLGFEGLHPYQINTLTKHILEKQLAAYGAEAEWEVSSYPCVVQYYYYYFLIFCYSH